MNNCPLCKGEIDKAHYLFAIYVIANKKNVDDYLLGNLTFESWKEMTKEALK